MKNETKMSKSLLVRESEDLLQYIDKLFPWYMLISVLFLSSSLSSIVTIEAVARPRLLESLGLVLAIFYLTTLQILALNRIHGKRFRIYDLLKMFRLSPTEQPQKIEMELESLISTVRRNLQWQNMVVWFSWLGLIAIYSIVFFLYGTWF